MKPAFVADLKPDSTIVSFFLVSEKELRSTREGKPFLRLDLCDRTGTIEARVWDDADALAQLFQRDDIIKVQARVENFRNKLQLAVEKLRRAEPAEIELADFFPHTSADIEELYARLLAHVAAVRNPWLHRLLKNILEDPAVVPRLKRAPAAKVMHHAYIGGLLEHVVSLCDLCRLVASHYSDLDADLLLAGALLHDIGKLSELCYERSIGYSAEGHLLGHIVLEIEQVGRAMDAIPGFPPQLKTLLQHLLISHHGHYEFGSPKLPMTPEALVLSFLDDLDSKLAAARASLSPAHSDDIWGAYIPALSRRFLRPGALAAPSQPRDQNAATDPPAPLPFGASAGVGQEKK